MAFADIAIGIGLVAAAGASAYGASVQGGIAGQQMGLAQDQQYKQDQSFQQLQQLISDPGSFFKSPVYQASFDQGTHAVQRAEQASGYLGSGNEAAALQSYGQSFGQQQLFNQEQLLAGMSGTGFNPAGAAGTASGAASSAAGSMNNLAGLLTFFGQSGMGGGGGGGGGGFVPMNDPSLAGGTAGWGG